MPPSDRGSVLDNLDRLLIAAGLLLREYARGDHGVGVDHRNRAVLARDPDEAGDDGSFRFLVYRYEIGAFSFLSGIPVRDRRVDAEILESGTATKNQFRPRLCSPAT
jgi:hypothetical protein